METLKTTFKRNCIIGQRWQLNDDGGIDYSYYILKITGN